MLVGSPAPPPASKTWIRRWTPSAGCEQIHLMR
jgi:hypothetical protein